MKFNLGKANLTALAVIAGLSCFVGVPAVKTIMIGGADKDWALFPFVLTCLMLILLIFSAAQTLKSDWFTKELTIAYPKPLLFGVAGLVIYFLLFKYAGYYLASLVFGSAACFVFQPGSPLAKRLINAGLVSLCYLAFVYLMFEKILGFRL